MTLIKSISGIRGTIGGAQGENLTPIDAVMYGAAYGTWVKKQHDKDSYKVVVGRDARISGNMIQELVMNTLVGLGINVINLDLSTTPTVEMAVMMEHADGGIILTASHNPKQWNALKLLNNKGEFLDAAAGQEILDIAEGGNMLFASVDNLGQITRNDAYIDLHIDEILALDLVNVKAIKAANLKVVVDGVNSTGGIAIPLLLEALGVQPVKLFCTPNGEFPHNPEPLKEHLGDLMREVVTQGADFGIVVDPDVDRLAFVDEKGEIIAIASFILTESGGFNGIGFGATSNVAKTVLMETEHIWSGAEYVYLEGDMALAFNIPQKAGMLVTSVSQGGVLSEIGLIGGFINAKIEGSEILIGGDIILSIAGVEISDQLIVGAVREKIFSLDSGETYTIKYYRQGQIRNAFVIKP